MIGTERMLLGRAGDAPADTADAPHVRNDIGKANEQWIASYRDDDGHGGARRVPDGHGRDASTRCAP